MGDIIFFPFGGGLKNGEYLCGGDESGDAG